MTAYCQSKRQVILDDKTQALPNTTSSSAGTVVGFFCKTDGYVIESPYNYVTCQSNGQWDKADPVCKAPLLSSRDVIIVSLCCSIGGAILIILISVLLWYHCCRKGKKNSHRQKYRKRDLYDKKTTHVYHEGDVNYLHTKGSYYDGRSFGGSARSYGSRYGGKHQIVDGPTRPQPLAFPGPIPLEPLPASHQLTPFNGDRQKPVPAAIIYDPLKKMWIDEYDVRIKIPRPNSNPRPLPPWTVEQGMLEVDEHPTYGLYRR